ncbi:pantoate--beta-alanine ligase [Alteromonas aestuariivivens]|uniref:Pantothenate synthetase n=1 Tax=Alteromonas aestuariivivens TaxID=1938339 RepID=A0A3D8M395_9ALTE|nr:pantoate--beta-alanine ligase [Alteromonas aestuariivivens]RDV24207.1 pantoate--beta-alanine ligase [Alteromonas aestuariivivens]
MQVIETIQALRSQRQQWQQGNQKVGFVPTMGNLHNGHLQLVKAAKAQCDTVVVSIFVNPMQFGANEDLSTYPRTIEEDKARLEALGVDAVFLPPVAEMYPRGLDQQTFVEVPGISEMLCGASRPGHFRGVATIVCKLFNMVQPDKAFFGQKDYQQLQVIRLMVKDLSLPVEIHGIATERESDGLAMSSRNGYLSAQQRALAPRLHLLMQELKGELISGRRDFAALTEHYSRQLNQSGFRTDYVEVRNAENLMPATSSDTRMVILIAAYLGTTRLIDNLEVAV